MDKKTRPVKPVVPDAAKVSVALSEDQKKMISGKKIISFFVSGDKLVATDLSSPAYKKHEEAMKKFYEERNTFDRDRKEAQLARRAAVAQRKAEHKIRSEVYQKKLLANAGSAKTKAEKTLARIEKMKVKAQSILSKK